VRVLQHHAVADCAEGSVMSDIVELKPATPGGKARSFYLENENEILQIDRLTMAIRSLATHPDDSPGDAYFGIALAIEECVAAIKRRGGVSDE
jgi:hypothetical protein